LIDPLPSPGGRFGDAVSTNGATIAVGADNQTAFGVAGAGSIYLYSVGSTRANDRYNSPTPSSGDTFGASVSLGPGGSLLVGDAPGSSAIGTAWLFFL